MSDNRETKNFPCMLAALLLKHFRTCVPQCVYVVAMEMQNLTGKRKNISCSYTSQTGDIY